MNNFEDRESLERRYQILEEDTQKIINYAKSEAVEAIRCMISQLDLTNNSISHLVGFFPDQQTPLGKAQTGLSIARSYLSEALNDIIINPPVIEVSNQDF